jgi:hypothetical protein
MGNAVECPIKDIQGKVGIIGSDAHWRLDPEHVSIQPALPQQETQVSRSLEYVESLRRCGHACAPIGQQLDTQHEAHSPNLSNERMLLL